MSLIDTLTPADYAFIGRAFATAGHHEKALAFLDRASPEDVDSRINRSLPLMNLGRLDEALDVLRRAILWQPGNATAWMNIGSVLFRAGQFDATIQAFESGAQIESPLQDKFAANIGAACLYLGDRDRSIREFRRAVAQDPENGLGHMSLGMLLMQQGQWAEGMAWYEGRTLHTQPFPIAAHKLPIWHGPELPKKKRVLVVGEQGMGDCFFFARFAQPLREMGLHLILFVEAHLVEIMRRWSGFEIVCSKRDHIIPNCDYQVAMGSLPYRLMQLGQPWMLPPGESMSTDFCPSPAKRIGLTWRGNPAHSNDKYRSMTLDDLAPLLRLPRGTAEWVAFQQGMTEVELRNYGLDGYIPSQCSWEDTLAAMRGLNLLITVDTSVAHLAGTLGIPTWMLLPAVCDWRWGLEGEATPWYPSVRLFRQQTLGDWRPVVKQVCEAMKGVMYQ